MKSGAIQIYMHRRPINTRCAFHEISNDSNEVCPPPYQLSSIGTAGEATYVDEAFYTSTDNPIRMISTKCGKSRALVDNMKELGVKRKAMPTDRAHAASFILASGSVTRPSNKSSVDSNQGTLLAFRIL